METTQVGHVPAMGSVQADNNKWEWLEKDGTYLLRLLNLPADLKRADLLVRVDGKRRLTITDRHKKPPTPSKELRLNKTFRFQLPKTANPDAITGCFSGVVLTLTVPFVRKGPQLQPAAAGAAAAKEEEPNTKAEMERELIDTAVAAKKEEAKAKAAEPEREKELIDTAVVAAFTLGVVLAQALLPQEPIIIT